MRQGRVNLNLRIERLLCHRQNPVRGTRKHIVVGPILRRWRQWPSIGSKCLLYLASYALSDLCDDLGLNDVVVIIIII